MEIQVHSLFVLEEEEEEQDEKYVNFIWISKRNEFNKNTFPSAVDHDSLSLSRACVFVHMLPQ